MNPIVFAMRRPLTVMVLVVAVALGSVLAVDPDADRHLPEPEPAGHLRRPALRRHGPGADGRAAHQLLRVSLPLHQRHPPRREPEHPGHGPDEAVLPPRHRTWPRRWPRRSATSTGRAPSCRRGPSRRSSCGSTPAACPVGYLVLSSETKSIGEIQDQALFKVRPMFASLPGVSAPPPFGGNQRTVVVRVDPERLRSYQMSPDEVVAALTDRQHDQPVGQRPHRQDDADRADQLAGPRRSRSWRTIPIRPGAGPDRLHPRRRDRAGRQRHPRRLRPGQRPPGRLHPGHQAGRRLDALGRQQRQGGPAEHAGGPARRHQGQLRVRPVADRHQRRCGAWRPRARWGPC